MHSRIAPGTVSSGSPVGSAIIDPGLATKRQPGRSPNGVDKSSETGRGDAGAAGAMAGGASRNETAIGTEILIVIAQAF
ncbi:hypothetical protein ASE67_03905 [Sphingomonas sp. Leaf23]|nr:hypothetical protein ASE67_03905 [Sphingomonas sp. Leaf23]